MMKKTVKSGNELTKIPYVGESIARDFQNIGINCVEDLKGKNPMELYERICIRGAGGPLCTLRLPISGLFCGKP
jgi:Pathogenicity locus.